jgi:hypothetical protein
MQDFTTAMKEKQTDEHSVIDEAYADRGDVSLPWSALFTFFRPLTSPSRAQGYTVFSIPVGVLFRPSANKIKNLKTKNYLGQAKLVAATDTRDAFTGFSGAYRHNTIALNSTSGSDGKGAGSRGPGLTRSKTSAARLEQSGDGVAQPLRRRPTAEETGTPVKPSTVKPTGLGRSQTMGGVAFGDAPGAVRGGDRAGGRNGSGGAGLLTPPSSDEPFLPNLRAPSLPTGISVNDRPTTYGGDDLIDAYYEVPSLSPMLLTQAFMTSSRVPIPEGQPVERVATWARQNVGAPPPQQQQSLSRQTSASEPGGGANGRGQRAKLVAVVQRQNTIARARAYGGEEADDFEGTVITAFTSDKEMTKVRVKLRYQGDTRGMVSRWFLSRARRVRDEGSELTSGR